MHGFHERIHGAQQTSGSVGLPGLGGQAGKPLKASHSSDGDSHLPGVAEPFGVVVVSILELAVRLFNVRGKMKRMGKFEGKRRDWRKAYVRLKAGEKAPDFIEGV